MQNLREQAAHVFNNHSPISHFAWEAGVVENLHHLKEVGLHLHHLWGEESWRWWMVAGGHSSRHSWEVVL